MDRNNGVSLVVRSHELTRGTRFDWHEHTGHQLLWALHGVLAVSTADGTWVLPTSLALWLPARTTHRTGAEGSAVLRTLNIDPTGCPVTWTEPTVTAVGPLLRALITHLATGDLTAGARARAEAVVYDVLRPVSATTIDVPLPSDERAREVARALTGDPGDGRTLAAWGLAVGASGRTLARLFVAETGMSFARWRTHVRLRAALGLLAAELPVGTVARRVGYATPSAFVAAFHRTVGVSPGAYFAPPPS